MPKHAPNVPKGTPSDRSDERIGLTEAFSRFGRASSSVEEPFAAAGSGSGAGSSSHGDAGAGSAGRVGRAPAWITTSSSSSGVTVIWENLGSPATTDRPFTSMRL